MLKREMHLGWLMSPAGNHPAAWLHPGAELHGANSFAHYVKLARKAEAAKFDFVFQADAAGARDGNMNALSRAPRFMNIWEPLSLLSALAGATERIGLAGTMSTSYFEPYNLARQMASLDHLSGGRAGWNVVTSAHPAGGYNFGRDGLEDHALRYERAREFVEICFGLWDSWDDDAFMLDRETGIYFDPDKMHYLRHKGKFFTVRGPLNIARPPQGRPVIIQAGGSEAGKELAAETAEVIFTRDASLDHARHFYADVKGRMARFGRHARSTEDHGRPDHDRRPHRHRSGGKVPATAVDDPSRCGPGGAVGGPGRHRPVRPAARRTDPARAYSGDRQPAQAILRPDPAADR